MMTNETAATFPAELKQLIKEKGSHAKQAFNCDEARKTPNSTYSAVIKKQGSQGVKHRTG